MIDDEPEQEIVIPLVEERATITKRTVDTGCVRIDVRVHQHPEVLQETLKHESFNVEHVPVGRQVEMTPAVREEGDVTIYPVMEERLVVEKRLFLKEELRVTRTARLEPFEQEVVLRSMTADVERLPPVVPPTAPNP